MGNITHSAEETQKLAGEFFNKRLSSNIVALEGDLGAGKTTFDQGLAAGLEIQQTVNSPTFLLVKSYPIKNNSRFNKLVHIDLYRINHWDELAEIDLPEIWSNPKNLVLIEWAERIKDHLPAATQFIYFRYLNDQKRQIDIL
jgi:tRNA threonylcarbamoyladenosine biosynthesis protein TsaE